jgi:hypothetical protein
MCEYGRKSMIIGENIKARRTCSRGERNIKIAASSSEVSLIFPQLHLSKLKEKLCHPDLTKCGEPCDPLEKIINFYVKYWF